jgi:hypothetical protein
MELLLIMPNSKGNNPKGSLSFAMDRSNVLFKRDG